MCLHLIECAEIWLCCCLYKFDCDLNSASSHNELLRSHAAFFVFAHHRLPLLFTSPPFAIHFGATRLTIVVLPFSHSKFIACFCVQIAYFQRIIQYLLAFVNSLRRNWRYCKMPAGAHSFTSCANRHFADISCRCEEISVIVGTLLAQSLSAQTLFFAFNFIIT